MPQIRKEKNKGRRKTAITITVVIVVATQMRRTRAGMETETKTDQGGTDPAATTKTIQKSEETEIGLETAIVARKATSQQVHHDTIETAEEEKQATKKKADLNTDTGIAATVVIAALNHENRTKIDPHIATRTELVEIEIEIGIGTGKIQSENAMATAIMIERRNTEEKKKKKTSTVRTLEVRTGRFHREMKGDVEMVMMIDRSMDR